MESIVKYLPEFNAFMNSLATICLLIGYYHIKKENRDKVLHRKFMVSAFVCSTIFLASYLVYHYHVGSKTFPELGWIKTVYLLILFPHIVLAVVMLPMIFLTFRRAFKGEFELHKKIAKPTFFIWLYVSLTGVIIYLMLYVFYGQ